MDNFDVERFVADRLGTQVSSLLKTNYLVVKCYIVESKKLFHAANFKEDNLAATSALTEEERAQV